MTLEKIKQQLYTEQPEENLYHYTSLGSLLNIIETKSLWATDINYFKDLSELMYFRDMCVAELMHQDLSDPIKEQLKNWFKEQIHIDHGIYVVCFSAKGNLLSQWRAYCEESKGVSIGFSPQHIIQQGHINSFFIGKCIYAPLQQQDIIKKIIDALVAEAKSIGSDVNNHASQSYHSAFETMLDDLLLIAALIKSPCFSEEHEWRAVSKVSHSYLIHALKYREGSASLIPYLEFNLPSSDMRAIEIERVLIGPSKNINRSISSISNFLSNKKCSPRNGISTCKVPYQP